MFEAFEGVGVREGSLEALEIEALGDVLAGVDGGEATLVARDLQFDVQYPPLLRGAHICLLLDFILLECMT